jgi:rifampicin phosphotransferase
MSAGNGRFLMPLDRIGAEDETGGKARALAHLAAAGFPVPPALVVLPAAFEHCTTNSERAALANAQTGAELRAILAGVRVLAAVRADLAARLAAISAHGMGSDLFAVRSSATDEDSVRHSFAGQLESFLFVTAEDVPDRVADVWRSGFSERVMAYCREHGLPRPARAPAVIVQRMVNAQSAGVAFSVDPVSGDRTRAVVGAVYGLGSLLVDGSGDADTYRVDASGNVVDRSVAHKATAHRPATVRGAGIEVAPVANEKCDAPVLDDATAAAVAQLARAAARHFGRPQDIEWAIEDGRLYLLQSRPITSLFDLHEAGGVINIWDNSNIAESYGGITTPLTFSFARNAYEGVYRQLCRTFGVPRRKIEENTALFANMLGIMRGRVYYNLLNWYRFLALLPGYRMNRHFMEQMMGVKESLRDGLLETDRDVPWHARLTDGIRFAGTTIGFASQYFTLRRKTVAFYARLENALYLESDLSMLRADELVSHYRLLESRLLSRWDAPLINDFYTMIFYGVLRKLCGSWCGDTAGTLQNDLLCGSGGMVSTEPARRLREMADIARGDRALVEALCLGTLDDIRARLARGEALRIAYESYLDKFGERCVDELKLESPTLHEEPLMLLRSIGSLARSASTSRDAKESVEVAVRKAAEARVAAALRSRPDRRLMFGWVLTNARERVRGRENMRLARTRLFGRVRRVMVELGVRFYERGLLSDSRDVFYLHLGEVLGFVEGTAVSTRLHDLATLRRDEYKVYAHDEPPASRFETRGMVYAGNRFRPAVPRSTQDGDSKQGIGCCPGVVTGRVRVVRDPRNALLTKGDILVAERTDPSWVMLFPLAAGLLVERGSLLSHSAIVAREMGIPAIVSIEGVMDWLVDGDMVELDGSAGIVRKLGAGEALASNERKA